MSCLTITALLFAATDGGAPTLELEGLVDSFAEYTARFPTEGVQTNTFSVPRVQAGAQATYGDARARVLLEGVYASQGGALLGVAGDSVVARLREAWAAYRWRFLEAQLGMLPTLVVPEVERAFLFRQLSPDGLEVYRIKAPADFGLTVKAHLPEGYGWVGASVTNGEGYAQRELNPGKDLEVAAAVHPLPRAWAAPLTVMGLFMLGTSGTASAKANRFGGGILWQSEALGLGVTAVYVDGWLDDGGRRGLLGQAFARGTLWSWLLLAARAQWFKRDLLVDDDVIELMGAVGVKAGPLELMLAVQRTVLSGIARTALPGVDATELRVVARFRWPPLYPSPSTKVFQ